MAIPVLKFPKGTPASHPFRNVENQNKLIKHIRDRLELGNEVRRPYAQFMRTIDRQLAGYIELDNEDRKRQRENNKGKSQKPVDVNLQLTLTQMEDMETFMMEVFNSPGGFFQAYAGGQQQEAVAALVLLMNKTAEKFQYFRHCLRFVKDSLKYNIAAMLIEWRTTTGTKIGNDPGGTLQLSPGETMWEGNYIEALDMYNVLWDPNVAPVDVPEKGEWFATIKLMSIFAVNKMASQQLLFNCKDILDKSYASTNELMFYEYSAATRMDSYGTTGNNINWFQIMGPAVFMSHGTRSVETCHFYGWLNPKEFGLSQDDAYQIWRITIADNRYVVDTERLINAHESLPVVFTMPNEDGLGLQQKSYAERLMPYQTFASFLFNVHQRATRKSLYGTTVYDPSIVRLDNTSDTDVAMKIPVEPAGYGKDVKLAFTTSYEAPKTEGLMNDIQGIIKLMDFVLPTNTQNKVADLDRATQYQAAAVVQGTNKRQHTTAKLIDDQALKGMRRKIVYNILQYQPNIQLKDANNNDVDVKPNLLREIDVDFFISDGLKGIDRLLAQQMIERLLNMIIQNKDAIQEIDVVALMNYFTEMIGDRTNLNQFRRPPPGTAPNPAAAMSGTPQPSASSQQQMIQHVMDLFKQNPQLMQQMVAQMQGGAPGPGAPAAIAPPTMPGQPGTPGSTALQP